MDVVRHVAYLNGSQLDSMLPDWVQHKQFECITIDPDRGCRGWLGRDVKLKITPPIGPPPAVDDAAVQHVLEAGSVCRCRG